MSDPLVIARIKKSSVAELWVTVKEYEGKTVCDLREYFHPADQPAWLPTRKGVTIPRELVGQTVDAVDRLAGRSEVGTVCEIDRGAKAKIRFSIGEYQQHVYGDIRIYFAGPDGVLKPGKGVTAPLTVLSQLAEAFRLAEDQFT